MAVKMIDKYYNITRLHKDDLREIFKDNKKVLDKINKLSDNEMEYLAGKLADDYIEQLYWISLKIIFESIFLAGE